MVVVSGQEYNQSSAAELHRARETGPLVRGDHRAVVWHGIKSARTGVVLKLSLLPI